VLYALACEELLEEPVESGRLYYCTTAGGFEERIVPLDDSPRHRGKVVDIISSGLKKAFFRPRQRKRLRLVRLPRRMRAVRIPRTSRKPGDRLFELKKLRELP